MKTETPKLKTETRNIAHRFTAEERDQLGLDLARSIGNLRGIDAEFDQVKSSFKARITEAEARIDRLSTDRTNGFVMRDCVCFVVFRPADKEKDFYISEGDALLAMDAALNPELTRPAPILTEKMNADDFQQELIQAESKFDAKDEIQLFQPVEGDRGILVVGKLAGKWFTALRVKIGKLELNERLDAEQKCYKNRSDAVAAACKRVGIWAKDNLGDLAAGFADSFKAVSEANKEKVE